MKRNIILLVLLLLTIFTGFSNLYGKDVKVYLGPNNMFFADTLSLGAVIGAEIEIGYSKFSPSDSVCISPEFSFAFSQTETSYFSSFAFKVVSSYNLLIFSFEKKNNLFTKIGIGTGISYQSVSVSSISFSGIGLTIEPIVGINYNFLQNLWIGLELRYSFSSDLNNRITPIVSPSIFIPFFIEF